MATDDQRILYSRTVLTMMLLLRVNLATATEALPRATPESMGINRVMWTAALDHAEDLGYLKTMAVVRDGHVVDERNWMAGFDIPLQSRSVTKSVVSILQGCHISL